MYSTPTAAPTRSSETVLIIKIDIAKSPNTMSGDATYEYRLEFAGDRVRVIREVSNETRVTTLGRLE